MAEVDIYNMALGHIGITETVGSLTERSKARETCSRFYDQARDYVLRDFPWPFAYRAVALAEVADATFPGWTYVYRYPTDCLQAQQVTNEAGTRLRWYGAVSNPAIRATADGYQSFNWFPPRIPFQLSSDDAGRLILSDEPDAYLVYTAKITDTLLFDPMFTNLVSRYLAFLIFPSMRGTERDPAPLFTIYQLEKSAAQAVAFNEHEADPPRESPSVTVRY